MYAYGSHVVISFVSSTFRHLRISCGTWFEAVVVIGGLLRCADKVLESGHGISPAKRWHAMSLSTGCTGYKQTDP